HGAWISVGGQRRALFDHTQSSQDPANIDGPPDPDALGRKQAVVLRIPHALVPVSPIPTDWNSRPSLFRFVARALFWMSHNGAPKTADRMLLIALAVRGACMISSRVLQALPRDRPMLPSPLSRRRKAPHYDATIATRAVPYPAPDLLSQRRRLEPPAHRHAGCRARRRRAQGAALADRSGASRRANERARRAASRLINADPDDVALISSVSYGVATAAKLVTVPARSRVLVLE